MAGVRYTQHARLKFTVLAEHGFVVEEWRVTDTVLNPDNIIVQKDKFIAQKNLSANHVLRVVYRMEGENRIVITFYPGRKSRYESSL